MQIPIKIPTGSIQDKEIEYFTFSYIHGSGADPEGRAPGARPLKIVKYMICLRIIVIFHTKYPKTFSRLPQLSTIFLSALPNLKSCIRPCGS